MRGSRASRSIALFLLVVAVAGPGCASSASSGDEILFGVADTAIFMGEVGEAIFWEVPRFILWTVPKACLYDVPRAGLLALAGRRTHVETCMERLAASDLGIDEELEICAELRELTGIPIRSREGWESWWPENRDLPEGEWLSAFLERQIALLESPDYFRRVAALEHLESLYRTTLGYDPKQEAPVLKDGARRWRAHCQTRGLP